jgi:hypothetical protein
MTIASLLKQPSAFIPLATSGAAFALILGVLATVGVTRQADEGTPARLFQLLMLLQAPVVMFFAVTWVPRSPRSAGVVLALQIGAALAALATVVWLEGGAA